MDDEPFDDFESDESGSDLVISTDTVEITTYSRTAQNVLLTAESLAASTIDGVLRSEHLLLGLANEPRAVAAQILDSCGFGPVWLAGAIGFVQGNRPPSERTSAVVRSPRVERILVHASHEAAKRKSDRIETIHLLAGLLREGRGITALILESPGVGHERLGAAISQATRNGVTDPS